MENNKNKYNNMNRSQGIGPLHKRALSSYDNSNSISRKLNYNNSVRNKYQNRSFLNTKYSKEKQKIKKINGSLEDYKRLTKKYYNIIIGLQDELTKQTIKNYYLLEENMNLKQKINDIIQNQ